MSGLPTVAIIGRPNVGKSTLFNRLVGKKLALVDDQPGVTRDRREGDAHLIGLDFRIIDLAGYEDDDAATRSEKRREGKECVSPWRPRWSRHLLKTNTRNTHEQERSLT